MYNEMMDTIGLVNTVDPELAAAMDRELNRQRQNIELIASENIVSPAVMAAKASPSRERVEIRWLSILAMKFLLLLKHI